MGEDEITFRVLPAEEFQRLVPVYEGMNEPLPIPERTVMYVAEKGGEIIGLIAGQIVICVSPLWVKREYRGKGVAERLAAEGYMNLPKNTQKVLITDNGHVERLASLMGFTPKLGQLFMET